MKAVILAAGRGSRMAERTDAKPKCLSLLAGKTLLDWQLEALRAAGIRDIGLVRGYRAELLAPAGVTLFDNPRWQQTNMVGSLACAAAWLAADDCIVSYADIVYPGASVQALAAAPGDLVVAYDLDWLRLWQRRFADPLADAETFRVDAGGRLTEIGARAASVAEIMGQYMGLLRFSPRGWKTAADYLARLPAAERDRLDMTALLRALLAAGVPIATLALRGQWLEVDSGSDLELYERIVAGQGGQLWPLRA